MAANLDTQMTRATLDTPIGQLLLVATPKGLIRLAFDGDDWNGILASLQDRRTDDDSAQPGSTDSQSKDSQSKDSQSKDSGSTDSRSQDGGSTEAGSTEAEAAAEQNVDEACRQLNGYFDGTRKAFDFSLDLSLIKGFRRTVAEHLITIPFGSTETYGEVAASLDNPNAVRAVGSACANNPIPIVIPCHRVLRSDGHVGGYLGGTSVKEYLLRHEGVLQ